MKRIPLRWALLAIFGTVTIAATAVVSGTNYLLARRTALDGEAALIGEVNRSLQGQVHLLFEPPSLATLVMSASPTLVAVPPSLNHPALSMLSAMLRSMPSAQSLYIGYDNGDFLRVVQLAGPYARNRTVLGAPDNAQLAIQLVLNGAAGRTETWRFLDEGGTAVGERITDNPTYDPRLRPWYLAAMAENGRIITPPYIFASTGEVGVTLAQPASSGRNVVAADMTLTAVSHYLAELKQSWTYPVAVAVFDIDRQVIATSQPLPESAGTNFVRVSDLHDAGLAAAVSHFFEKGVPFVRATLQTPTGR